MEQVTTRLIVEENSRKVAAQEVTNEARARQEELDYIPEFLSISYVLDLLVIYSCVIFIS